MTTTNKPQRLDKAQALKHWRTLEPVDPAPAMEAIPYKTTGSKYGYSGIRIDGTREFIDAVLSNLKSLTQHENGRTRLELNYTEVIDRESGYPTGNWVCYVRVHERSRQVQMMAASARLYSANM
jgi:hypothetical protein